MNEQKKESFFDIDRDGRELADILQKIDENLLQRPMQTDQEAPAREALQRFDPPCDPPDTGYLRQRVHDIRLLQAPYFVLGGKLLSKIAYVMNIPLFIFGKKQERFNRQLADTLDALIAHTEHMRTIADYQRYQDRRITEMLNQMDRRLNAQETLSQRLDHLEKEHQGTTKWMDGVSKETRGNSEWLEVINTKLMRFSLNLREQQDSGTVAKEDVPAPRILNEAAYHSKIKAAGGVIRVNLGCGEKPKKEYINVDRAELPGVDVVADIRRLPFEPASLDEIASEHLVEHFREHQFRQTILPQWKKLLKSGGVLRTVCPNWQVMLERLHAGSMTLESFKQITFGAQDYEGDDHFAMYTPETFSGLLRAGGFTGVSVVETQRMNGICPEMEITAIAP